MEVSDNSNNFQLDTRSTTELLQFLLEFAKQVTFVSDNEEVNDWGTYLSKNPLFSLVPSVNTTPQSFTEDFLQAANKSDSLLGQTLQQVITLSNGQTEDDSVNKIHQSLKDILAKNASTQNESIEEITPKVLEQLTEEQALLFYQLLKQLENSFQNQTANHAPDIALLIVFAELYQKYLLPDLNKLPQKLTEFYYEKILDKQRLAPVPDTAHIYFQAAKHVKTQLIEKGIKLYAGRDANNNVIEFETQDSVQLSQAKIKEVRTLHFVNQEEAPNSQKGMFQYIRNYDLVQDLALNKYFETFGKDISIYRKPLPSEIVSLGFAIASPLFFLKEAERTISIYMPIINEEYIDNLVELFQNECDYQITTKEGWQKIVNAKEREDKIKIAQKKNGFEFTFFLNEEFPPIVPFSSFAKQPAIKCIIKEDIYNRINTYQQLTAFQIDKSRISITVEVKGKKELTCYNDLGILNIGQPFQPFGAVPNRNSKFIIGNKEVFQKPINSFSITFDWNLPSWNFINYFKAYKDQKIKDINNYKVELSFVDDSIKFKSENGATANIVRPILDIGAKRRAKLEDLDDLEEKISTHLEINEEHIKTTIQLDKEWKEELPDFNNFSNWGYLVLELIGPNHAFGTGRYQHALTTSIQSTVNIEVNPPMIPELTGLRLDYTASNKSAIDFDFYHIHPFGTEKTDTTQEITLLTNKYEFEQEANNETKLYNGFLFLGIDNLSAGSLSIYFELANSSLIPSNSDKVAQKPQIFLIKENDFVPLTIITDTTDGLEQSGIIKINIDKQLLQTEIGNTIVPNTLFWLALKAKNNTADYSLTSEIKLHGVSAVRLSKIEERPNSIDTPIIILPANTIQRTLSNEPNIKEIRQPFPSFQGRALEALIPYKKRIATELKHRNRPTQTEEVEAILLAQFPEINKIKLLQNKEENEINIIIIPHKREQNLLPSFSITFLKSVQTFLKQLFPPFIKLKIENPHYAIIQTHSYINLKRGGGNIDIKQMEAQIKHKYIYNLLNPWNHNDSFTSGTVPNFFQLKNKIEKIDDNLSLEDFEFYYYFLAKSIDDNPIPRRFGVFSGFKSNHQSTNNLIFVPDENLNHHKIFFELESWSAHKEKMITRSQELRPVLGYSEEAAFDKVL